jgi:hypothetical protein
MSNSPKTTPRSALPVVSIAHAFELSLLELAALGAAVVLAARLLPTAASSPRPTSVPALAAERE